jgi:hypothetical protein
MSEQNRSCVDLTLLYLYDNYYEKINLSKIYNILWIIVD